MPGVADARLELLGRSQLGHSAMWSSQVPGFTSPSATVRPCTDTPVALPLSMSYRCKIQVIAWILARISRL